MARRGPTNRDREIRPTPVGDAGDDPAARAGELVRRAALGLAGALMVARMYFPGEGVDEESSASGLGWTLAVLVAAGLAAIGPLVSGRARLRWAWPDLAMLAMTLLVGLSAGWANERRVAINLAWQWGGVAILYVLLRVLPRGPGEARALLGSLVAAAVAVAGYGLYQVTVEFPRVQALYRADPVRVLAAQGIDPTPDSPQRLLFEYRLFYSNEPFATFALANSLAGFLVGAAVLAIGLAVENLGRRRDSREAPAWPALMLAAIPGVLLIGCLMLTKSRSAYLGLVVGLIAIGWSRRRLVGRRALMVAGGALVVVVGLMAAVAGATGRLDSAVLSQARLSVGYRLDYWRGAWGVLTGEPGAWWSGLGPGNFRGPYLRHKPLGSSEEIADPHNLVLEAWATAGIVAALALVAAIGLGLRELFGRPKAAAGSEPVDRAADPAPPPRSAAWLVATAGVGGWLMVVVLGQLLQTLDDDEVARWLILGAGWGAAVALGGPLWRRRPIAPAAAGAAAMAVATNLLAAGGIGIAPVALGLWATIGLGIDLRDDRPSGRQRLPIGRGLGFGIAAVLAALGGTFYGAVLPAWESGRLIAEAKAQVGVAESSPARAAEALQRADQAYERAARADVFSARPWLGRAGVEFLSWRRSEGPTPGLIWPRIDSALKQAATRPRNPLALTVHRTRADMARAMLDAPAALVMAPDRGRLLDDLLSAATTAARLNPTDATLAAQEADALARLGRYGDAAAAGREALRLDAATPHLDRKLRPAVRSTIEAALPGWERGESGPGDTPPAAAATTPSG